jgi:hypothetical protein
MKDSEILEQARDLIADVKHWCKGHRHLRAGWRHGGDDNCILQDMPERWCAVGAIAHAAAKNQNPQLRESVIRSYLNGLTHELFPEWHRNHGGSIMGLNDSVGHDAVIQVFEKGIAQLQEQGR